MEISGILVFSIYIEFCFFDLALIFTFSGHIYILYLFLYFQLTVSFSDKQNRFSDFQPAFLSYNVAIYVNDYRVQVMLERFYL